MKRAREFKRAGAALTVLEARTRLIAARQLRQGPALPWRAMALSGALLLMLPIVLFAVSERQAWLASQSQLATAVDDEEMQISGSVSLTESNAMEWMVTGRPGEAAIKAARAKQATRRNRSGLFTTRAPSLFGDEAPARVRTFVAPVVRARPAPQSQPDYVQSVKHYRTLCVRTCDGFYWPISYGTTRDDLPDDAAVCKASCGSPVKLYIHDNPGQEIEQMSDLNGGKYTATPTAFAYRSALNASCQCKPEPWAQASLDRHQKYAELVKAGKMKLVQNKPFKARNVEVRRIATVSVKTVRRTAAADFGSAGLIKVAPARKRASRAPVFESALTGQVNFSGRSTLRIAAPRRAAATARRAIVYPEQMPKWMR